MDPPNIWLPKCIAPPNVWLDQTLYGSPKCMAPPIVWLPNVKLPNLLFILSAMKIARNFARSD